MSAPVPRFAAGGHPRPTAPAQRLPGRYFPKLSINPMSVTLTAIAGGAMTSPPGYIPVQNSGGGIHELDRPRELHDRLRLADLG